MLGYTCLLERRTIPGRDIVVGRHSQGMSSSSVYSPSSRHCYSEEEWNVSHCTSSANSKRDSNHVVGAEDFSVLRHPGYEWVDPRVKLPLSRFGKSSAVASLCNKVEMIASTVDENIVSIERTKSGDSVCHDREGHSHDFFYMYSTLVTNLHVCLPLDDFTMGVLRVLNMAPNQLHPNSWASLHAIRLIECST